MKGEVRKNTNQKTITALKSIAKENNGLLMPEIVVETAKNPRSPLHDCFDWDDSSAAGAYRIIQARHLIRACIEYIDVKGQTKEVNIFCSLSSDQQSGGGYRETISVLANRKYRDQFLQDALAEMKRFVEKYEDIKSLANVIKEMKKAIAA